MATLSTIVIHRQFAIEVATRAETLWKLSGDPVAQEHYKLATQSRRELSEVIFRPPATEYTAEDNIVDERVYSGKALSAIARLLATHNAIENSILQDDGIYDRDDPLHEYMPTTREAIALRDHIREKKLTVEEILKNYYTFADAPWSGCDEFDEFPSWFSQTCDNGGGWIGFNFGQSTSDDSWEIRICARNCTLYMEKSAAKHVTFGDRGRITFESGWTLWWRTAERTPSADGSTVTAVHYRDVFKIAYNA